MSPEVNFFNVNRTPNTPNTQGTQGIQSQQRVNPTNNPFSPEQSTNNLFNNQGGSLLSDKGYVGINTNIDTMDVNNFGKKGQARTLGIA